jgi:hypothetical protein
VRSLREIILHTEEARRRRRSDRTTCFVHQAAFALVPAREGEDYTATTLRMERFAGRFLGIVRSIIYEWVAPYRQTVR